MLVQDAKTAVQWAIYAEETSIPKLLKYIEKLLAHIYTLLPTCRADHSSLTTFACLGDSVTQ